MKKLINFIKTNQVAKIDSCKAAFMDAPEDAYELAVIHGSRTTLKAVLDLDFKHREIDDIAPSIARTIVRFYTLRKPRPRISDFELMSGNSPHMLQYLMESVRGKCESNEDAIVTWTNSLKTVIITIIENINDENKIYPTATRLLLILFLHLREEQFISLYQAALSSPTTSKLLKRRQSLSDKFEAHTPLSITVRVSHGDSHERIFDYKAQQFYRYDRHRDFIKVLADIEQPKQKMPTHHPRKRMLTELVQDVDASIATRVELASWIGYLDKLPKSMFVYELCTLANNERTYRIRLNNLSVLAAQYPVIATKLRSIILTCKLEGMTIPVLFHERHSINPSFFTGLPMDHASHRITELQRTGGRRSVRRYYLAAFILHLTGQENFNKLYITPTNGELSLLAKMVLQSSDLTAEDILGKIAWAKEKIIAASHNLPASVTHLMAGDDRAYAIEQASQQVESLTHSYLEISDTLMHATDCVETFKGELATKEAKNAALQAQLETLFSQDDDLDAQLKDLQAKRDLLKGQLNETTPILSDDNSIADNSSLRRQMKLATKNNAEQHGVKQADTQSAGMTTVHNQPLKKKVEGMVEDENNNDVPVLKLPDVPVQTLPSSISDSRQPSPEGKKVAVASMSGGF